MEDTLVPIALFAIVPLTTWIVSSFGARKRDTIHLTLRHAIDNGQTLDKELLERMSMITDPVRLDLRRGVLFITVGIAFALLGLLIGAQEPEAVLAMFGIALFPGLLGLAYLGLWLGTRGAKS